MSEMVAPLDSVRIVGHWDDATGSVRALTDNEVIDYARRTGLLSEFTRDRAGRWRSRKEIARRLRRLPCFGPPTSCSEERV